MGIEREWKYRATPELQRRLEDDPALCAMRKSSRVIRMETTYLDTAEREFRSRKWTLRMRRENGSPVVTLKTPAQNGARGEWEHPGDAPDAGRLIALGAPEELRMLLQKPLKATCGARFTRRAILLELPQGGLAELALDEGILFRETRQEPLCEIELEHLEGEPAAAEALATLLQAQYALQPEPKSKFLRASQL